MSLSSSIRKAVFTLAATTAAAVAISPASAGQAIDGALNPNPEVVEKYSPRFGRSQPVIAVVAANGGTELTDFMIPFGILSSSGVADVVPVSTLPDVVTLRPALRIRTQATLADFDQRFVDGADYVVVPALINESDPALLAWIKKQYSHGATIVSICNGAEVVAASGLLDGHRSTAHWGSEARRLKTYPNVRWEKNIRYTADGRFVSSAGISASIPVSLALVEAIAGHERAAAVARRFGVQDWSSKHNSDAFQLRPGETAPSMRERRATAQTVGIPVAPGVDEVALALTAEAYSHTGKAQAVAVATSTKPVATRHGLLVVPEIATDSGQHPTRTLDAVPDGRSAQVLDRTLASITTEYGENAAYSAARIMEYPGYHRP